MLVPDHDTAGTFQHREQAGAALADVNTFAGQQVISKRGEGVAAEAGLNPSRGQAAAPQLQLDLVAGQGQHVCVVARQRRVVEFDFALGPQRDIGRNTGGGQQVQLKQPAGADGHAPGAGLRRFTQAAQSHGMADHPCQRVVGVHHAQHFRAVNLDQRATRHDGTFGPRAVHRGALQLGCWRHEVLLAARLALGCRCCARRHAHDAQQRRVAFGIAVESVVVDVFAPCTLIQRREQPHQTAVDLPLHAGADAACHVRAFRKFRVDARGCFAGLHLRYLHVHVVAGAEVDQHRLALGVFTLAQQERGVAFQAHLAAPAEFTVAQHRAGSLEFVAAEAHVLRGVHGKVCQARHGLLRVVTVLNAAADVELAGGNLEAAVLPVQRHAGAAQHFHLGARGAFTDRERDVAEAADAYHGRLFIAAAAHAGQPRESQLEFAAAGAADIGAVER